MKKRNLIISILIFVFLIFITLYAIFLRMDYKLLLKTYTMININYLHILVVVMFLYFFLQGVYSKIMLKTLNTKISIFRGMFYSMIEFLFSAITPGSSGGQPAVYYCMTKDKIAGSKVLITLILNTIMFKLFFVVFGIIILIFRSDLVYGHGFLITVLFFVGLLLDLFLIIMYYLLMFNNKIIKFLLRIFYKFVNNFKKNKIDYEVKIKETVDKYSTNVSYIKKNKLTVFKCTIITFVQRLLMFSVAFIIYKSLGLNGETPINIVLAQLFTQSSIEAIPLPGGTGAIEIVINEVMYGLFGEYALIATLFIRTVTFYAPLLIIIIIFSIFGRRYFHKE